MSLVLTTINYKEAIKGFPPSYFLSCSCFALVLWFTKIGFLYLIQLKSDFNSLLEYLSVTQRKRHKKRKIAVDQEVVEEVKWTLLRFSFSTLLVCCKFPTSFRDCRRRFCCLAAPEPLFFLGTD